MHRETTLQVTIFDYSFPFYCTRSNFFKSILRPAVNWRFQVTSNSHRYTDDTKSVFFHLRVDNCSAKNGITCKYANDIYLWRDNQKNTLSCELIYATDNSVYCSFKCTKKFQYLSPMNRKMKSLLFQIFQKRWGGTTDDNIEATKINEQQQKLYLIPSKSFLEIYPGLCCYVLWK